MKTFFKYLTGLDESVLIVGTFIVVLNPIHRVSFLVPRSYIIFAEVQKLVLQYTRAFISHTIDHYSAGHHEGP